MTVYSNITWAISLGKVFISISSVNLRGNMSTDDYRPDRSRKSGRVENQDNGLHSLLP